MRSRNNNKQLNEAKASEASAEAEQQSWLMTGDSLMSAIGMVESNSSLVKNNPNNSIMKADPIGSYTGTGASFASKARSASEQPAKSDNTRYAYAEPTHKPRKSSEPHQDTASRKESLASHLRYLRQQYRRSSYDRKVLLSKSIGEAKESSATVATSASRRRRASQARQVRKQRATNEQKASKASQSNRVSLGDAMFLSLSNSIRNSVKASKQQKASKASSLASNKATSEKSSYMAHKRLSQLANLNYKNIFIPLNSAEAKPEAEMPRSSRVTRHVIKATNASHQTSASSQAKSEASKANSVSAQSSKSSRVYLSETSSNTITGQKSNPNFLVTFRNYYDDSLIGGPYDFGFLCGYRFIKLSKALKIQPKMGTAKHPKAYRKDFRSLIPKSWIQGYYWHDKAGHKSNPDWMLDGSINDYTTNFSDLPHFTLWLKSKPVAPIQIAYYYQNRLVRKMNYTPRPNEYGKDLDMSVVTSKIPSTYYVNSIEPKNLKVTSYPQKAKISIKTKLVPQHVRIERIKESINGKTAVGRFADKIDSSPHTPDKLIKYDGANYAPAGYEIDDAKLGLVQARVGDGRDTVQPRVMRFYYKPKTLTMPVYFVDHSNHQIGTSVIKGVNTEQITTSRAGARAGVPKGYRIDPNQNDVNVFRYNDKQPIRVYVQGHPYARYFTIHRIKEHEDGKKVNADDKVVKVKGHYGQPATKVIEPINFCPAGYKIDINNANNVNHHPRLNGNGILEPSTATYYYQATKSSEVDSPVKPIGVIYRNQNGSEVGHSVVNGYMDQQKTVHQLSVDTRDGAVIPKGYTINSYQDSTVKFGLKPQTVTVKTTGKPAKQQKGFQIKRYREGAQGLIAKDEPIKINFASHVGDKVTYSARDYEPLGYVPDKSKTASIDLVVNPDQTVSSNGNSFFYRPVFSDEKNSPIMPVQINYISNGNGQVLNSILVNGYTDERINLASLDSVPKGYEVTPGQDYYYKFTVQPTAPVNIRVEHKAPVDSDVIAPGDDIEPKLRSDYIFVNNQKTTHARTVSLVEKCPLKIGQNRYVLPKKPIILHSSIIFNSHDNILTIKPSDQRVLYILGKYKFQYHKKSYYRFMTKVYGRIGYITTSHNYITPAYYTDKEFSRIASKHRSCYAEIIGKGCYVYDDAHLYSSAKRKFLEPGRKIRVYGMVGIDKHHDSKHFGMTRLAITHHHLSAFKNKYITGNKTNIKLI